MHIVPPHTVQLHAVQCTLHWCNLQTVLCCTPYSDQCTLTLLHYKLHNGYTVALASSIPR